MDVHFSAQVASFDPAVAQDMNINSATQIQQLLFAPCENKKKKETMPRVRAFDVRGSVLIFCLHCCGALSVDLKSLVGNVFSGSKYGRDN